MRTLYLLFFAALAGPRALAQTEFVNWETPHVHPLERGPALGAGRALLAVNTPDDRLEVFETTADGLVLRASVPVGVDPVSVRWRTGNEVWVVNQLSDSVSIVDLATFNVVATLAVEDEPADVVFSKGRAFVSCSQANCVLVFDAEDRSQPPRRIAIDGEDPRALAVGLGGEVYVAIFESGNQSTVLGGGIDPLEAGTLDFPPNVVDDPLGPWGGLNPPPNAGAGFEPPMNASLPNPPGVSLIVKRDDQGRWLDDSGGDWTAFVSGDQAPASGRPQGWQLVDHDVAIIDAAGEGVTYVRGLMNACMALAVQPGTGTITLVGTDGTNERRFEPNLKGTFGRVLLARIPRRDPDGAPVVGDLNPHLDYSVGTLPQSERDRSIGDPRAIVWGAQGRRAYIAGMGSNNVLAIDAYGERVGPPIEVGEGPTGLVLDEPAQRLYVLNKFESSVSVVDLEHEHELARYAFHDPEPAAIKLGRRHLYDTHATSGLGQVACASCHIDARFDRLAWDLGDPRGELIANTDQNKGGGIPGLTTGFKQHHPMKGPMTTQTLQDIIGKEPLHWRGDRTGLEEFNDAFVGLQGDDAGLDPEAMQQFKEFLATIHFPPNPFRELDNGLPTDLPLPGHHSAGRFTPAGTPLPNGDAVRGLALYRPPSLLDAPLACVTCHTLPTGMGTGKRAVAGVFQDIPLGPDGEAHHAIVSVDGSKQKAIKIPHLRNMYDKVGFELTQTANRAGFGFLHDGSIDSIARFIEEPAFGITSVQDVADLVAFMLAFSGSDLPEGSDSLAALEPPGPPSLDTHAAVGQQLTLAAPPTADEGNRLAALSALALDADVGLIVKGRVAGEARGFVLDPASGRYQSDRAAETWDAAELVQAVGSGAELTWTVVPFAARVRAGVDRDSDGFFDRDELDLGSDPADADSTPEQAAASPKRPNTAATPSSIERGSALTDAVPEGS